MDSLARAKRPLHLSKVFVTWVDCLFSFLRMLLAGAAELVHSIVHAQQMGTASPVGWRVE